MSVTIWLKILAKRSIFESRLDSRPLSVATTGVDTAAEDGRSPQESGIGRWRWIMQLVLARLREAWPLLLIALFALHRWWLRRYKKEFPELQNRYGGEKAGGGPSSRMAPRDAGPRRDVDPCSRGASGGLSHLRNGPAAGRGPPLWVATANGNLKVVKQLLDARHNTEQTHNGWTPLMKAAEEGYCEILKVLLEARAYVNAINARGRNVLSFAAAPSMGRHASIPALELVLNADADLKHEDKRGQTARARAIRDGFREAGATIDRFVAEREQQR